MQEQKEKLNCRPDGNQTPEAETSQPASASTSQPTSPTSAIGVPASVPATSIGKLPSATALDGLRVLAQQVKIGQRMDDATLETLLNQRFGQRIAIRRQHNDQYETTGITAMIHGVEAGDQEIVTAIEYLNQPAPPQFIAGKLARMRTTLARRVDTVKEMDLMMDTMMGLIKSYPPDAIAWATEKLLKENKFFPVPKEIIVLLDEVVMFRRAILAAMKSDNARLSAPIPERSWRDLPKGEWDGAMWDAWIGDAEKMLTVARTTPLLDAAGWEAEVEKRKATRAAQSTGTIAI